jgi:hypothetical protein
MPGTQSVRRSIPTQSIGTSSVVAGIIAGESLMVVILGLLAFLGWTSLELGKSAPPLLLDAVSLLVLLGVLVATYRIAVGGSKDRYSNS